MKISKSELLFIIVALFVGLHFYNQYKLDNHTTTSDENIAELFYDRQNPPVIVAFGDSLTYGTGAREDGIDRSYPAQLSKLLGVDVINEGVPGEMASRAQKRFESVLKKYNPDIVILCEGGNDILRSRKHELIKNDLKKMVESAKSAGAKVILLGVPEPQQFFLRDAKLYRDVANETGVLYLEDIISDVLSDGSLRKDQIHPNAKGYAIIAQKIDKAIRGGL